jgi:hypothetical protein
MTCADFEILLADYLDGTLDTERRREVEAHRAGCPACAEFAGEVSGAVAFFERVPEVEPPPELLTRITFEIPAGGGARKGWRTWFGGWLQPVLQPKFAMGMAMTLLSFSMLGRYAGIDSMRLRPADLHPAVLYAEAEDRLHRTWERAVKYYENLKLVYEVQARLQEWSKKEADADERRTAVPPEPKGQARPAEEGKKENK